jgi:hypothetical protein
MTKNLKWTFILLTAILAVAAVVVLRSVRADMLWKDRQSGTSVIAFPVAERLVNRP